MKKQTSNSDNTSNAIPPSTSNSTSPETDTGNKYLCSVEQLAKMHVDMLVSAGFILPKSSCKMSVTKCQYVVDAGLRHNEQYLHLHKACNMNDKENKELFHIDFQDSDGWSGLHHACGGGHLPVVKYLLDIEDPHSDSNPSTDANGGQSKYLVNINLVDNEQCSPLWVAAFNGHRDIVQVTSLLLVLYYSYTSMIMYSIVPIVTMCFVLFCVVL